VDLAVPHAVDVERRGVAYARRAMQVLRRLRPLQLDLALSLVLTVLLQAELWLGERYQGNPAFPGSKAATAPFLLVATVALAWRRRRPTLSLLVVMSALAIQSIVTGGAEAGGGFALILISVYSAAAYGAHPVVTVAATALALAAHDLNDPFIHSAGDATFSSLFAVVGFALGRALHGRGLRARVLEGEAERLRRERDERAERAVAEERARLARELHDIVAHSVSVMVLQSLAGQSVLNGSQPEAREAFVTIERTGRQAMDELRRLLAILREDQGVPDGPQPGVGDLQALASGMRKVGLDVSLTANGDPHDVPPGVGLAVYRIVQEALTNALKHAGANSSEVEVSYRADEVTVRVRDRGSYSPAPGGDWGAGHGLVGMRERAALYGGRLEAGPAPDGGYVVEAWLPLAGAG
jgi:signal transduction histidine kinase